MTAASPMRVLLLALALLASRPATAAELPGAPAFNRAADALITAMGEPGRGSVPPLSDPRVQAVLARANINTVFGSSAPLPNDLEPLLEICQRASRIELSYMLDKTAGSVPPDPSTSVAEQQKRIMELMDRNAEAHQDVIAPMIDFGTRCTARAMPLITEFFVNLPAQERTPVRLSGLAHIRHGLMSIMMGAIGMVHPVGISPANRRLMLAAAADTAPAFSPVLTLSDRKAVSAAASAAKATAAPTDQPYLDALIRAFSDERCEGLCPSST